MRRRVISIMTAFMISLLLLAGCSSDSSVTGDEWLVKQEACFEDLKAFADGMDSVYTLYFIESITTEDFKTELELLNKQYKILVAFYEQMKEENPIKPESHSYLSKRGTEAMENIYDCLGEIIANSVDQNGKPLPPTQLAYSYLAYRQELIDYVTEFDTAVTLYKTNPDYYEIEKEN